MKMSMSHTAPESLIFAHQAHAVDAAANRMIGNLRLARQSLQRGESLAKNAATQMLSKSLNISEASPLLVGLARLVSWRCFFVLEQCTIMRREGEKRKAIDAVDDMMFDLETNFVQRLQPKSSTTSLFESLALRNWCSIEGSMCRLQLCKLQLLIEIELQSDLCGSNIQTQLDSVVSLHDDCIKTDGDVEKQRNENTCSLEHENGGSKYDDVGLVIRSILHSLSLIKGRQQMSDACLEQELVKNLNDGKSTLETSKLEYAVLSSHFYAILASVAIQGGRIDNASILLKKATNAKNVARDMSELRSVGKTIMESALVMPGNDLGSISVLVEALNLIASHCSTNATGADKSSNDERKFDAAVEHSTGVASMCFDILFCMENTVVTSKSVSVDDFPNQGGERDGESSRIRSPDAMFVLRSSVVMPFEIFNLAMRCSALLVESDLQGSLALIGKLLDVYRIIEQSHHFPLYDILQSTILLNLRWIPMYLCGLYLMSAALYLDAERALEYALDMACTSGTSARYTIAAMYAIALVLADEDDNTTTTTIGGSGRLSKAATTLESVMQLSPLPSTSVTNDCAGARRSPQRLDNYAHCGSQLAFATLNCRRATLGLTAVGNGRAFSEGDNTQPARKALRLAHKQLRNQQLTSMCLTALGTIEIGSIQANPTIVNNGSAGTPNGRLRDAAEYFKSASTLSRHLHDLTTAIVAFDGMLSVNTAIHHPSSWRSPIPDTKLSEECLRVQRQCKTRRSEMLRIIQEATSSKLHEAVVSYVNVNNFRRPSR